MSWAKFAIEKLKQGETVQIRPRGHSMKGRVNDGDLVTVAPCKPEELSVGDIVLVRVKGHDYLHLIKALDHGRFLSTFACLIHNLHIHRTIPLRVPGLPFPYRRTQPT